MRHTRNISAHPTVCLNGFYEDISRDTKLMMPEGEKKNGGATSKIWEESTPPPLCVFVGWGGGGTGFWVWLNVG